MVREDIFEGLKSGLANGKSLQESMQSFYNSGYDKKEIEEAAKALLYNKTISQQEVLPAKQIIAKPVQQPQTKNSPQSTGEPTAQMNDLIKTDKLVSYYDTQPKKRKKSGGLGLIILLVVVLIVLLGALAAVFFFKESISNFFQ